jgi:type IV pilus assembly protein PilQ
MVAQNEEEPAPPPAKRITGISAEADSESVFVRVRGSQILTFTSVKQPFPLGVILYFPETVIDTPEPSIDPAIDTINGIHLTELNADLPTARVEISLKRDVPYVVDREGNDLKISFRIASTVQEESAAIKEESTDEPHAKEETMSIATAFQSVEAEPLANGVVISVKANGAIKNYNAFTIESPARIVFDFFNIKSPHQKEEQITVQSEWVQRIRHYSYQDRLRLVLDTTQQHLAAFSANPTKDGLSIKVGEVAEVPLKKPQPVDVSITEDKTILPQPAETATVVTEETETPWVEPEPGTPAWVNRIDFLSKPEGKSIIVIGTTRPIKYDLQKIDENRLQLKLFNTKIPDDRQRPLITTRFPSAVDRITPFHTAEQMDTALVSIELREAVPYFIEQEYELLQIIFDASSLPPRSFEEAKLPAWKKALTQAPVEETESEKMAETANSQPPTISDESRLFPKKKYTGEKIALDFFETDIKNVFRILREVSGKNFAIDKDVAGKVTLSLDKPVPWDQVLDLVLKMNQLGTIKEGDIIRIATQATLQNEQEIQRAASAAALENKKQEKALEPLVTAFIPVNYANAASDVMPHIVLTPERGSITVDERNNQVIITDTEDMVEQARETVRKIDQVTPQVLIEARVVEASNSFSRELGTQLSAEGGPVLTRGFGNGIIPEGSVEFDMSATNPPAQSLGQIGINFSKLIGSPFTLDARLAASESEGEVKIISSPRVLTLDNKTARIRQGTQVPVPKLDDSGNTVIEYKDVDLELEVTPHVTPDKRIALTIKVTNNEIGQIINNQQSFTTKEANTELLVDDGETIVIGGIRKTKKDIGESGVPGFRNVPVLGWLFKKQTRSEDLEELLIFISPQIVQLEQRG